MRMADRSTRGEARTTWRLACLVGVVWFLANGHGVGLWAVQNGFAVAQDKTHSRIGLAISKMSTDDAVVAVTRAGSLPYFSNRRSIDLLGKSDPVIAKGAAVFRFVPGHNKWNLDHSMGSRRPDLVCAVLSRPADLLDYLAMHEYLPLHLNCFVREDTQNVEVEALRTELKRIHDAIGLTVESS